MILDDSIQGNSACHYGGRTVTERQLSNLLCTRTHPYPVTLLPIGSGYFRAKPFPVSIPRHFSNLVILHLPANEDGTNKGFRNVGI
jgi:hypothetical protein